MHNNPFPGMNPWLESCWGDVHTSLTTYARDQLQPQLPAGLRARVEEYVSVEAREEGVPSSRFAPDVRIIEREQTPPTLNSSHVLTAEPIFVPRHVEPETLHYIQILDTQSGHRIVTSIEFLSRANKSGAYGKAQYRKKQRKMLAGNANLVEIDLLRAGCWVLAVPRELVPANCREPYRINVVRASNPSMAEMYPTSLQKPLPNIRIPLRETDDDVVLQLQRLIDLSYENGGYAEDINYAEPPEPSLTASDEVWIDQLLRHRKLR